MKNQVEEAFSRLISYCNSEGFKGFDPYDGLNSTLFKSVPGAAKSRLARLVWIQGFKKSPVNLRPLTGIKKEYNPKALGLFLSGYAALYKVDPQKEFLDKIYYFIDLIGKTSTRGYSGACWGYNFDWESRAFFLKKYSPTVVVSSFVANALLDAFGILSDTKLLETARSTCDFILKDLNRTYDEKGNFIFSYSKNDSSSVYNASLLGSRLLARVYSLTGESLLKEEAGKSVEYVCDRQRDDGSWTYGKLSFHQWVDNFHTGYNLECISDYMKFTGDRNYTGIIQKGFQYYKETFFTAEGASKYFNTKKYPVDIHSPAQFVITVCKLGKLNENREILDKVLDWTINNMQSSRGYFYYQIWKYYKIKISYMRWSQAWMFYALSTYLLNIRTPEDV